MSGLTHGDDGYDASEVIDVLHGPPVPNAVLVNCHRLGLERQSIDSRGDTNLEWFRCRVLELRLADH